MMKFYVAHVNTVPPMDEPAQYYISADSARGAADVLAKRLDCRVGHNVYNSFALCRDNGERFTVCMCEHELIL